MMDKNKVLVALTDKKWINAAKQLFSSIYFNSAWNGDVLLLIHEDKKNKFPEKEIKWFNSKGIKTKKIKPLSNRTIGRLPPSMLGKFYLFTPFFKKWNSVVYVDLDCIITRDIPTLRKRRGFFAVKSLKNSKNIGHGFNITAKDLNRYESLKNEYDLSKRSFNAGVFSFTTDIIQDNTFAELNMLFNKYGQMVKHQDQSIFNLYF